jgi:YVTN family beta-propeller protein
MNTKCPLPKGFSGTKRVSGLLVALLVLALVTAPGAGAAPFAYISSVNSGTVTVIDGTTALTPPPNAIAVGAQPFGVAVNPAGTRAYVANSNAFDTGVPSVSVIDTASLSEVARITAGITGQPSGVAVNDDGSLVYVANSNGTVAVIDAATNTVVNTLMPPPGQPRQLAGIVVAGGSVWATDLFTGEVLNVTDNSFPGLFVSFGMMGIAANISGSRLYVSYGEFADGNLKIAIIDVATSFAQQTFTSVQISTNFMDSGANPGGIAVSPSGAFVYAPVLRENKLAVMNTSNNSVLPLIPVGLAPFGVAVDPMGTRVYVGVSGNGGTVTVLDGATNTVLQTGVPVGANPMVFGSFVADARPAPPPPQFPLTVLTAGNGFGSVMANPMPTNGTFAAGTVVTLTATPNSSSQFGGWSGVCSGTGACRVTMDAAKSVTATFTAAPPPPPAQFTLTTTTNGIGSGSITANPASATGKYNAGTDVSLAAAAAAGSKFAGWSGACTGTGACSVTMNAAKSVTASFTVPPPSTCDDKIKDLLNKVAAHKHPWWQDHQLKVALKMYGLASNELGKAKAKVGGQDTRVVRAQKEFDNGKAGLCSARYWRADHEFWEAYEIAHQILKHPRR